MSICILNHKQISANQFVKSSNGFLLKIKAFSATLFLKNIVKKVHSRETKTAAPMSGRTG